jgi:hypothetical protein
MVFALGVEASSAQRRHVDRLAILVEEHKQVSQQLLDAQAEQPQDKGKIGRIQSNLEALNNEITRVHEQPVYEDKGGLSAGKTVPPTKTELVMPPSRMEFEGWDVFRNFGRNGNATKAE